jgi:hypothetical protein
MLSKALSPGKMSKKPQNIPNEIWGYYNPTETSYFDLQFSVAPTRTLVIVHVVFYLKKDKRIVERYRRDRWALLDGRWRLLVE